MSRLLGKSVGIIGGGLAGLGVAVSCAKRGAGRIEIFDQAPGPGIGGASSVAAGLCHPFTSRGTLIYKGLEGFDATLNLLKDCKLRSPDIEIYTRRGPPQGILRLLFDSNELSAWETASNKYPHLVDILTKEQLNQRGLPDGSKAKAGAFLKTAVTIDTPEYLKALWGVVNSYLPIDGAALWTHGTLIDHSQLESIQKRHDIVIVASGVGVAKIWPEKELLNSVKYVRGQNLIYAYPQEGLAALSDSLIAGEYIVPKFSSGTVLVGATYEYGHVDDLIKTQSLPDMEIAESRLKGPAALLYESLEYLTPISCQSGVRVVSNRSHLGKVPIISRSTTNPNLWLITGFGSRGVIHHGLFSERLVQLIDSDFDIF